MVSPDVTALSPVLSQLRLWCAQSSHGKLGGHWSRAHSTLYALSWEQAMCTHVCPVESKLLTALLLVLAAVQASQGGSTSLCQAPGLGHSIYGSNCSLPRAELWPCILLFSSESPPWGKGPSLISSLPFLPGSMGIFLITLVV